ncbi:hypothetical protein MNV49_006244 [Pseudohyphozyma bogoriensis]|nr:hypothetical protein MNV49_006244 [Pseudohyphozyma bogoriensis]
MDDLLDLDFSKPSPATNGGAKAGGRSPGANYGGRSTFDYLSSASLSSQPSSSAPSRTPSPFTARPLTPSSQPASNAPATVAKPKLSPGGEDAFASLFGASPSSSATGNATGSGLSMAERLARDSANKLGAGWGATGSNPSSRAASPALIPSKAGSLNVPQQPPSRSATSSPDPWDFDLLSSKPKASSPSPLSPQLQSKQASSASPQPQSTSLDPFDDFGFSQPNTSSSTAPRQAAAGTQPPTAKPKPQGTSFLDSDDDEAFDRSKQDGLLQDNASDDEFDILGDLSKPLIEMGFDIPESRNALLSTINQVGAWDVQAAATVLLSANNQNGSGGGRAADVDREEVPRPRQRPPVEEEAPRPTGRRAREAAAKAKAAQEEESAIAASKVQDQAAELFSQASKIGFSMFKSANAYWETGKAAAKKVIDENMAEAAGSGEGRGKSREAPGKQRPKWMTDDFVDDEEEAVQKADRREQAGKEPPKPIFQDSDDEDPVLPQRPSTQAPARRPPPRDEVDSVLPQPQQLSASAAHKTKGNELFKLGRFGDAEQSYGKAIEALPQGTLALIPLYNNRASARLKVGEEKGAAEDCSAAITIILGPNGVVGGRVDIAALDEESASLPTEAKDVSLRDQLAKALGRRAKANEVNEKWKLALADWEVLMGGGDALTKSAGGSKLVGEGLMRCRKALSSDPSAPKPATPAPSAAPRPRAAAPPKPKPVVQGSGEAVKALRNAAEAAANEDDLRLSLKDSVDAKIIAWKGGKEANLRALIASLENVLWPELEWKKVGMHELISEGQLKVRYVRAIAKVHPDKLNVGNTTVEQRMIAGAVFAGLNDAWNSSKA